MRFPKLPVIDAFDPFPDARIAAMFMPAGLEVAIVEPEHLVGASQEGTCTPLVMWPMGTANSDLPG